MNLNIRLKKLEQLEGGTGETDLSHLTDQEILILINAFKTNTLHFQEVQAICNKIIWLEDSSISQLTEEELEQEIKNIKAKE